MAKLLTFLTIAPLILAFLQRIFKNTDINGSENPREFAMKTNAQVNCKHCKEVTNDTGKRYYCGLKTSIVKQNIPKQYYSTGVADLTFNKPCTLKDWEKCTLTNNNITQEILP